MMLDELILSRAPLRFAESLLDRPRESGSFLLVGPSGVGKATFAKALSQALHKASHFDPDLFVLAGEETIKIDEIRELSYFLGLREMKYRPKISLILDAERLTLEAGNALLKTLEEPRRALLILTASSPELLLPTVVSRCLLVRFGLLQGEAMQKLLQGEGLPEEKQGEIAFLSGGRVGEALKLSQDERYYREARQSLEAVRDFLLSSEIEKLLLLNQGAKTAELKTKLRWWLGATLLLVELKNREAPPLLIEGLERLSLSSLLTFASLLTGAITSLNRNQNANLVLGDLIMNLVNPNSKSVVSGFSHI